MEADAAETDAVVADAVVVDVVVVDAVVADAVVATMDAPSPCEPGFASCASVRCGTNLRDDQQHCGACGRDCYAGNQCAGGTCVPLTCPAGFGDCVDPRALCETDLARSTSHCGACNRACTRGTCVSGRCYPEATTLRMPGSMLTTTSARPWFRWNLPFGADGVRLQVCSDRACSHREIDVVVVGESHRAATALAAGVHFWRVYTRRGGEFDAAHGPVWAFSVPPADRVGAHPGGAMMDFDGDGLSDNLLFDAPSGGEQSVRVGYGAGPGTPARTSAALGSIPVIGETRAVEVLAAGDLDGDGFGDGVIEVTYTVAVSASHREWGGFRHLVLGRRDAAPALRALPSRGGPEFAAPIRVLTLPLGNALRNAGLLLRYRPWTYGFCSAEILRLADGTGSVDGGGACADGPTGGTSGDYDGDGATDVVLHPYLTLFRETADASPVSALLSCPGAPATIDPSFVTAVTTADMDDDGYDDLLVHRREPAQRYVIYGGPTGLSGGRCVVSP